jgi:NAD(P)-dependent dehydrogenase (short-subunit alcohol dehydrogenase family)
VIITGRRQDPLEATQREIGPDRCHVLSDCDVGKPECWKRIADKVEELGGQLHFLGNTAGGSPPTSRPYMPFEEIDANDIIAYNTRYITGVQLSYHYLAPYLIKGAETRESSSVVINMSSAHTAMTRGGAAWPNMYHTCKQAVGAITRCAYGLYKDTKVESYGIAPYGYVTDMLRVASGKLGITAEQFCRRFNPFPVEGQREDIGILSTAVAQGTHGLESGVTYGIFPIPPQYRDIEDLERSGSILYSVAHHGSSCDELDYMDAYAVAFTKIPKAFYSNGKQVPEEMLEKIRQGLSEARLARLQSQQA